MTSKLTLLQALLVAGTLLTARAEMFPKSTQDEFCTGESCDKPDSAKDGEPTKFLNIGYLSNKYDLIKGNPHMEKFDPGFKAGPLFNLTYEEGKITPDGRHLIPDHVSASNLPSCSFDFTSSTITQTGSYSSSLSVDASVSGGGWGASFSASVGYKEVYEASSTQTDRFYSSKAECTVYTAEIDYVNAKLNEDFRKSVLRLGTNESDPDTIVEYRSFVDNYGTHFVSLMRMGGRYGFQSRISHTNSMEMSSQGLDVKVAAGYSGLVSVSAESATEQQKKEAAEFDAARTSVKKFFVGGAPPTGNWTAEQWALTVEKDPLPTSYQLVHIETLFIKDHFPEEQNLAIKKSIYKKVMLDYCNEISLEPMLCQKEFHPDRALIPIKVLQPKNIKSYKTPNGMYLYSPVLMPFEKLPGVMIGFRPLPNSTFVIRATNQSALADLVRPASGWLPGPDPNPSNISPLCSEGFGSIGDFAWTPYLDNFTEIALPCFAKQCITTCRLRLPTGILTYYVYSDGFPYLGGNFLTLDYSYFRYPRNESINEMQRTCLLYDCLDF